MIWTYPLITSGFQSITGKHIPDFPMELYLRAKAAVDKQTVAIKKRLLILTYQATVRQSESEIKEYFVLAMKRFTASILGYFSWFYMTYQNH